MFRERKWVRANFSPAMVEHYEPWLVVSFQLERAAADGREPSLARVRKHFERRYAELLAEDRAAGVVVV